MNKGLLFVFILCTKGLFAQNGDYRVKAIVSGNGFAHNTEIYFDDESWDPQQFPTYGWDPCCDANMFMGNANQPHIYTNVIAPPLPANNQRISINGLPHLFEPIDVPLGLLPGQLASYTFTFTELGTMPPGVTVELEDLALNVTQDLLADSTYDTWSAPSDEPDRFVVHFNPGSITSIVEPNTKFNVIRSGQTVTIFGSTPFSCKTWSVYDLMGRRIMTSVVELSMDEVVIDVDGFSSGIYLIELQMQDLSSQKLKIRL